MKHTCEELQSAYERLGSWNKVAKELKVGLGTLSKLKNQGKITQNDVWSTCLVEAQRLYDSGMSISSLSNHYSVSMNRIQRLGLKTRSLKDSMALVPKKVWTDAERQRFSELAKNRGLGGYNPHPNKGSRYKDIWFDSSYEVQVAKSLDEHNIKWERPKQGFSYGVRKYYPDFYLPDFDMYLDPKNEYLIEQHAEKIRLAQEMNGITVLVLTKDQLTWSEIQKLIMPK